MPDILVTGGAGSIGSALVARLASDPSNQITIADNLLTGSTQKVPSGRDNVRFVKCDVNDYNDISPLFFTYRFDYVFHYAAVVGVERTLANPIAVLRDLRGIENILGLAKNVGVRRIYYASSSEVYGEPVEFPQNEDTTPLNSRLPYAVVKNAGEAFLRTYEREFGLEFVIFRFFNTYGPNQSNDFVLPRFVHRALAGKSLKVYGDGSQSRTFCHVDDNVDACVAAHLGSAHANDTINVGSDVKISIRDLAELVIDVCGSRSTIEHLPPLTEGDMPARHPDVSKMRALLGRPAIALDEGIRRLAEHYQG